MEAARPSTGGKPDLAGNSRLLDDPEISRMTDLREISAAIPDFSRVFHHL